MEANLLEYRILSFLRNRAAYLKYVPMIKENLFETKQTKFLYKMITHYHKVVRGKQLVPLSSLITLVSSKIKPNEIEKYNIAVKKIKRFKFNDFDIADEIVRKFAKRQVVKLTILDAVHSIDTDDDINLEKLKARLDEAISIQQAGLIDGAYDYFTNPHDRLKEDREEERIATLLSPELDRAMRRGLAGGELAIVVAPTSVGKTMFLINIAYNAMRQGKKVVYITLELSGKKIAGRFDQLVTLQPYQIIEKNPALVYKSLLKLKRKGGGLKIKDVTATRLSTGDIGIFLESIRKDYEFDMLIVDQIDLMYSPKEYKERRHELSSLIISLRRLGASYSIPIWTASQATRIAGATGATTIWDIAEDIGKANWADVVLTLSQSPEDKEENIMFMEFAKNRIGDGNPRILLETNYPLMKLKGVRQIERKRKEKKGETDK